jgi:hypothetical protein
MANPPPPGPGAAGRGSRIRLAVVAVVLAALGVSAFVAVNFDGVNAYLACPHTCPSDFGGAGIARVAPGSIGCATPAGAVCYRADYASAISGLTLSGLRFNVAGPTNQTIDPDAPGVPLGPTAKVSALGAEGQVVGVWSMPSMTWQIGSGAPVPKSSDDVVILDTGLLDNSTLLGAYFYIILTGANGGSVGFPLACAGC